MLKDYRIKPNEKLNLAAHDPDDSSCMPDGEIGLKAELKNLRIKLVHLQLLLYAQNKHKVLIVLQAMDSGGKDGTIRSIFQGVNPQGVKVVSFKVPTPFELAHDYLWRVHSRTPASGEIVIFNRSHYEDVLIVRVKDLVPEKVWQRRFEHINQFEKLLTDEGTTILKFFLHISKSEQKKRFLERINNSAKNWKFNPGDIEERGRWDAYMQAYENAIRKTSTNYAPWYIIPANNKVYRNFIISSIIVDTLEKLKMNFPQPVMDIEQYAHILEQE